MVFFLITLNIIFSINLTGGVYLNSVNYCVINQKILSKYKKEREEKKKKKKKRQRKKDKETKKETKKETNKERKKERRGNKKGPLERGMDKVNSQL